MVRILAATAMVLVLFGQSPPIAREDFTEIQQQAHSAHQAGDKAGYVRGALRMQTLLNNAPDAVEAVARAYAEAGDPTHALDSLAEFVDMGQVDESLLKGTNKAFSSLADSPRYKSIVERMARNKAAVSRAEMAFTLTDPGIVAEDIDYDPQSKSFLITSVLEKKIIRVTTDGSATDFAQSPSHWPMLAIKVDSARNVVWSTEVALNDFTAAPEPDWGRSAVLCFDIRSGKLLLRIEGPPKSALGDMVLTPGGDPIVSDGSGGGIYRVIHRELTQINGKDFISPQTSTMLPGDDRVFVPDYVRGIGILDLRSGGHVAWLNQSQGKNLALNGVDGLYFDRGSLILTQNGTSPERVIRLQLDKSLTRVVSSQIIEEATPTLGDPTHGVVVGDWFYYIANSGWSELDDHGDVKTGSKLSPAHVMRFKLR